MSDNDERALFFTRIPYIPDPTIRLCPQSSLSQPIIPAVARHLLGDTVQDRQALCTCRGPSPGERSAVNTRPSKPLSTSGRRILNDDSKFSDIPHECRWLYWPESFTKHENEVFHAPPGLGVSEIGTFGGLPFIFHACIPKCPDGYIRWSIAITFVSPSTLLRLRLLLWLRPNVA
jgi:hypothetical protein